MPQSINSCFKHSVSLSRLVYTKEQHVFENKMLLQVDGVEGAKQELVLKST